MVNNLKIELGDIALKEIVLDLYCGTPNGQKVNYDEYDCYFYLKENGDPIFVVEQKS